MTVREMKNDVVRRLTKLDNNDAKTMQSIWLFITKTLPEEDPEEAAETQDNEDAIRQRGKEAFLTIRRMAEAGELPELTMDENRHKRDSVCDVDKESLLSDHESL